MSRFIRFRLVIPALLVVALAALLASSALAAPKSRTQSASLTIPAAAFSHTFGDSTGVNGGGFLFASFDSSAGFTAPVLLPDGAEITNISVYYGDNDPTSSILLIFAALPLDSLSDHHLAVIEPSGDEPGLRVVEQAITHPARIVDSSQRTYFLGVELPRSSNDGVFLRAVKVDYNLN